MEDASVINFRRFTYFGFWKIESDTKWRVDLYRVYRFLAMFWITFFTLLQVLDLHDASSDLHHFSSNLCGTSTSIFTVTKSYIMLFNMGRIERLRCRLFNNLHVPNVGLNEADVAILQKSAKDIVTITKTFFGIVVPTVLCWTLIPLIDKSEERKLPLRLWFPLDFNQSPVYEFVYVYQSAGLWIFAVNVLTIDLITYGFVIQICAQYEILEKNLRSVTKFYEKDSRALSAGIMDDAERDSRVMRILKDNIVHHQKIIREAEEVETIFSRGILVHMTCGAVLICVIGFDIIMTPQLLNRPTQLFTQLGYVGSALFDVFFYCLYGENLTQKSLQVSNAAYDILWYDMGVRPRRLLNFFITRAQKPTRITAGKLFPINLATYLNLLKLSYNMMAVMKQMTMRTN